MEFLVLVRPDFLTSLLCAVENYFFRSEEPKRHQVGLDAHRKLALCQCSTPRVYLRR